MTTRNDARNALLAHVGSMFDRVVAHTSDAKPGTRFDFASFDSLLGTTREATRAVMVETGKDEDGQPILSAKKDESGKRITEKVSVSEVPSVVELISSALASTGEYTTVNAGRQAGLWLGAPEKAAPVAASALKSEIAALKAELAALRSK